MSNSSDRVKAPLFYYPALAGDGDVTLADDEANHVKAQRLRAGDAIALFDGLGTVAHGSIAAIGRREVRVAVVQRRYEPPATPCIELYCAPPKGERLAVLLDMTTQLGMHRFTPIRWQRGVVEPGAQRAARWRRICIEACKQSRCVHVPEVSAPATFEDALAHARSTRACLLAAHPRDGVPPASIPGINDAERMALFVGPEGGLTDEELHVLKSAGAHLVSLGNAVLRIETAAVALIAVVNAARITAG